MTELLFKAKVNLIYFFLYMWLLFDDSLIAAPEGIIREK